MSNRYLDEYFGERDFQKRHTAHGNYAIEDLVVGVWINGIKDVEKTTWSVTETARKLDRHRLRQEHTCSSPQIRVWAVRWSLGQKQRTKLNPIFRQSPSDCQVSESLRFGKAGHMSTTHNSNLCAGSWGRHPGRDSNIFLYIKIHFVKWIYIS